MNWFCPKCGAVVPEISGICPSCYAIRNIDRISDVSVVVEAVTIVKLHYVPTRDDYFRLIRRIQGAHLRPWIVLSAVSLIGFLCFPFMSHQRQSIGMAYRSAWAFLVLPFLTVLLAGWWEWSVRKRWIKANKLHAEYDYEFDETGVRVSNSTSSTFVEWDRIVQTKVWQGLFLLRTEKNAYFYFPANLVPDLPRLQALAAQKIKSRAGPPEVLSLRILIFWIAIIGIAAAIVLYPRRW